MTTYCVTKCPKKSLFSMDGLNLLISLILHDKIRFYPLGMKIAKRPYDNGQRIANRPRTGLKI